MGGQGSGEDNSALTLQRDKSMKTRIPHMILPHTVTLALQNNPNVPSFPHITWGETTCPELKMPFPSPVSLLTREDLAVLKAGRAKLHTRTTPPL